MNTVADKIPMEASDSMELNRKLKEMENTQVEMKAEMLKMSKQCEIMKENMMTMRMDLEKLKAKEADNRNPKEPTTCCSNCRIRYEIITLIKSTDPEISSPLVMKIRKLFGHQPEDSIKPDSFVGDNPLLIACLNGNTDRAIKLLENGSSPYETHYRGWSCIHLAARGGHKNCLSMLLDRGVDVDRPTQYGHTPLHIAAFWGRTDCVSFLLDKGAKVESENWCCQTPLHWAVKENWDEQSGDKWKAADILLKHGAEAKRDIMGRTPLDQPHDPQFETLFSSDGQPLTKKIKIQDDNQN